MLPRWLVCRKIVFSNTRLLKFSSAAQLGVSVEDLIGTTAKRTNSKRGSAPKLQQQLERIQSLPKAQQKAIAQAIESVIAAHQ